MMDYVLIAEVDKDNILFFEEVLKKVKFPLPVYFVQDGFQLIEHLTACNDLLPSLILMNITLPKIPGLEVLKYIRNHSSFDQVNVVVFSKPDTAFDGNVWDTALANGYIIRPDTIAEMGRVMVYLLEKWTSCSYSAARVA